jgi:hypothetical protein
MSKVQSPKSKVNSPAQKTLYRDLKQLCHEQLGAEIEFTAALTVIRTQKLYRDEYGTFEEFCRKEFEMPARSIRRKMAQKKLFASLPDLFAGQVSLSAVGALLPVPAEQRAAMIATAVAAAPGGRVTVKQVEAVVKLSKGSGASYVERSDALRLESRDEDFKTIGGIYGRFQDRVKTATAMLLAASNDAREMGIHLQMVCGHEQMPAPFWNAHCAKLLPFDLEAGKKFIAVTHKLPDAAASFPEVAQFVTPILIAEKVLRLPERTEAQTASTGTPVQVFYGKQSLLRAAFKKITLSSPMREWGAAALRLFVAETEWVVYERERAENLLTEVSKET